MKRLLAVILLAAVSAQSPIRAQTVEYPNKLIHLIVPFPAGSETDGISRIISQKLSAKLGRQVIVENRPGASGGLGSDQVAKSNRGRLHDRSDNGEHTRVRRSTRVVTIRPDKGFQTNFHAGYIPLRPRRLSRPED